MPHKNPDERKRYMDNYRKTNIERMRELSRLSYERCAVRDGKPYNRGQRGKTPIPVEKRLWARVVKSPETDGCWVWMGAVCGKGYGVIGVEKQRMEMTHRVSWRIHRGEIPDGMDVLHTCDNPPCMRPDHLFLGTQLDNMRDASKKGRLADRQRNRTHCKHGHGLTPENIYSNPKHGLIRGCKMCHRINDRKQKAKIKEDIRTGKRKSWRIRQ